MNPSSPRIYVQQPIPQRARAALSELGTVLVFPHVDRLAHPDEAAAAFREADYVFALGENPITEQMLDGCDRLRLIAAMEIFPTQIDLAAATARGIPVSGLPHSDEITETTAEFTMALLLSVAWGIPRADGFLRAGHWVQYQSVALPARRLRGASLGIIGLGKVGEGLARRAIAHGMKVSYHDTIRRRQTEEALSVRWAPLDGLLADSDFVALCVLLTRDTEAMVDEDFLSKMKRGAVLVNTSRGRVVDESAVANALDSGTLGAVGMDVYRREPPDPNPGPSDPRLLSMDNIVLTPHIGTSSTITREWMANQVVTNISRHLRGLRPEPILNPEVYGERSIAHERIG